MRAAPDAPRVMLGPGGLPGTPGPRRRAGVLDEVAAWRPLLGEFDRIRVRGPLSQATVTSMGLEADVVGDPALALPDQSSGPVDGTPPTGRARVGVNFGVTDDLWGGDHVELIATTVQDRVHLVDVAAECARAGTPVAGPNAVGLAELDEALHRCTIVLGEKLHALVLAARLGIPTLALEYRPKCRDFQLSIGRGEQVLRTSDVTVDSLVDFVAAGLATAETDRPPLRQAVAAGELRLGQAAEAMRQAMARAAA
jgi:polysaccharide pyruvyl transferase WcaK-like protein